MRKHHRLGAILELLNEQGSLDVDDAAVRFDVSAATVRRDLELLAGQHLLTRTHGGAVSNAAAVDLPLRYKVGRRSAQKQQIGRCAAEQVSAGSVVGLNGGTTTSEVARALAVRDDFRAQAPPAVSVVTNSLNIAAELAVRPHLKVVVTGGVARPQSYELVGPLADGILDQLSLDVVFLGVDGIDVDGGAMTHQESEASINRLMAQRARRVVVVADSSKLGGYAFARLLPISAVDALITDADAPDQEVRRMSDAGVDVIIA